MILERLKNNGAPELKLNTLQLAIKSQIESRIEKGIYKFERVDVCPICGSNEPELVGEKDRYGLYYPVNICKTCGLLYTNPRMDQDAYNRFYNEEYRKLYLGEESPNSKYFNGQYYRGKRIFNFLEGHQLIKHSPSFILEIGCGPGGILKYFQEKGHVVKGIDLDEEYITYGRNEYKLDLEISALEGVSLAKTPNIIICSHIIEHFLQLNRELELIRALCDESTIIYVEVPGIKQIHINYESNVLKYFQNAHTYHFSLSTINNLFKKNGFSLITGNEFVMSAFRLGQVTSEFENDYQPVIGYLKKQEKLRLFYKFTPNAIKLSIKNEILNLLDLFGLRQLAKRLIKTLPSKT